MVDAGSGPSSQDQEAQRTGDKVTPGSLNRSAGGSIKQDTVAIDVIGSMRTPKKTLELAGRVGEQRWAILIESGSTGNFVSAQVV